MSMFIQLDLPALLLAILTALVCAIPGNFLVLRRQSLMGDAISHVVLPGIVMGFLISGTTQSLPMLLGALVAAIAAVGLIELVRRLGRLEAGAAMGVVFTTMFAAGVVLLEQTAARDVHIDVQHALYGNIEGTIWLTPANLSDLLDINVWLTLPEPIVRLGFALVLIGGLTALFFKELAITTFDPGLAQSLGVSPGLIGAGLVSVTAIAAVAAFDAVGSILVIAMFVCPPATARMLTDNLKHQVAISLVAAFASATLGYAIAVWLPLIFGFDLALSAAGCIAVMAGLLQLLAMLFAPRYGAFAQQRSTVSLDMT